MPTGTPFRYPFDTLYHGGSEAFDLQDQPLHTLQQFTDEKDFEVGQLRAMYLGLAGSSVGQSTSSLELTQPAPALSQLADPMWEPERPPDHALKASSPATMPLMLALLDCPGEMQSPLSQVQLCFSFSKLVLLFWGLRISIEILESAC